jgi:hypothetical protein
MPLMTYVPPGGSWERRAPAELGLRADGLAAAIAFHRAHESRWARDFMTASGRFIGVADEPPDSRVLGPVKPRGDVNGVVIRHGYVAAAWGDTARSDMSFSITRGSGFSSSGRGSGASDACSTRHGWRSRARRARSIPSTDCCGG